MSRVCSFHDDDTEEGGGEISEVLTPGGHLDFEPPLPKESPTILDELPTRPSLTSRSTSSGSARMRPSGKNMRMSIAALKV